MTTVGIIGAGHIGSALAKGFAKNGYDVVIANSRGPETLTDLVATVGDRARAATAQEAAEAGDIVVVTVPLKAYTDVPVAPLAGKTVLDTNNYYFERDGHIAALDDKQTTTSQMLQEHLPQSTVVKAFNHIRAADILTDGSPAGTEGRRALATSGDSDEAVALVTRIYDEFGFDTVNVGPLSESWRVERDQPAYVVRQTAEKLTQNLARAER
ncbi:NAD(P)-binding domain-containing protein [Microbacterium sp. CFBP 13617]|uniref:NADPH-dependent F420 reductase n=1 Tax=Microbacterium sp. CFBP 13617 TaxID=2774035 RepID=UPI00178222CA|nr:NAD(P)-binding domain-containing protein [Microbacterium sp. CFBP 13617]MBD8219405.1 NAD(P)-binding domain-containing protein [Microbacterium sp. CFBP 13617]